MNKIIIVEDRLGRAISLANQFHAYADKNPELELEVAGICYFCPDMDKACHDIDQKGDTRFEMKPVNLLNFKETMDIYLNTVGDRFFLIMDYMLENDGSEGIPMHRVNIRYARGQERYKTDRIWFYTGTGKDNERILGELVGKKHVLEVKEVDDNTLHLDLDLMSFRKALLSKDVETKKPAKPYIIWKQAGIKREIVAILFSDTIIEPLNLIASKGIRDNESYLLSYIDGETGGKVCKKYGRNKLGQLACLQKWNP